MNQTLLKRTSAQNALVWTRSGGLVERLLLLCSLLVLELFPITEHVRSALTENTRLAGLGIAGWLVAFAALFLCFGYRRVEGSYRLISADRANPLIAWRYLAAHLAVLLIVIGLVTLPPTSFTSPLLTGTLLASVLLAVVLAVFAFFSPKLCAQLLYRTGYAWLYAATAATAIIGSREVFRSLWEPSARLTFAVVEALLSPFVSDFVSDPSTLSLGTQRFEVTIVNYCGGLEGLGLMLIFTTAWLWFFRKEFRFPQALLLIPAGLLTIFFLNSVRIALLLLIGSAGAPNVAVRGFHSQAGWIAFNLVAIGFSLTAQRLPWFAVTTGEPSREVKPVDDPTAAYLIPFLAILAAAMISRAATGGFEWLYPLRFFAAAAALWFFRSKYASLDWHFSWFALVAGCAVFVMWMGLDSYSGAHTDSEIGAGLASLPQIARVAWLTCRTLAAVVTVPIAEELAFRGYLLRRLISRDFESVDPGKFTYFAVLASSVVFGSLHGDRWPAGIAAGIVYAAVFIRRGRIGDAVVAHATTNALLAAWVLARGAWYLW